MLLTLLVMRFLCYNFYDLKGVLYVPKKQTEWTRAFNEKAYDRLAITIPKGRKQAVEAFAKDHGKSVNGLVNDLLQNALGMTDEQWKAAK